VRATLRVLPYQISDEIARHAIRDTPHLTGLRGRLDEIEWPELHERGLRLFLDVGHNPEALIAVRQFFEEMKVHPIVIFGIMKDKDVDQILNLIKDFAKNLIAVAADTQRSLPSAELATQAKSIGIHAKNGGNVKNGVQMAINSASTGNVLLLSGSHYVIGEFLRELSARNPGFNFLSAN
jgi:dihydrofolate synthase/folylpolyglutamate synthase